MYEKQIDDYRESHTKEGKGEVYHTSFSKYSYRKHQWLWEKKALADLVKEHATSNAKTLDFACGTGRIIQILKQQTKQLTGVDVSDTMLEVCKKDNAEVSLIKADITKDNVFAGNKFELITAFRFFLNAQEGLRKDVLDTLNGLLDDDGVFICNNHGNTFSLGAFLLGGIIYAKNLVRSADTKIYNFHTLSFLKFEKELKEAGFKIIATKHRSVYPIMNEKTSTDVSKFEKLEDWFSSLKLFKPFSRNIIYVCKKIDA